MVVRCERCETRFKLDESRIPARGARVRCSRCKHAFFVTPPGAAPEQVVHELAAAAARQPAEAKRPPEPSWDLEEGPGATVARQRRAEPEPEEDQTDWRFEDEVPGLDPGATRSSFALTGPQAATAIASVADPEESSFADLGDPETWDLLAGDAPPEAETPVAPPIEEPAPEPAPSPAPAAVPAPATEVIPEREAVEAPPAPAPRPRVVPAARRSAFAPPAVVVPRTLPIPRRHPSAASGAGWAAVAVLVAAILWGALRPPGPAPRVTSVAPVAGFEVSEARARVVENAAAGSILVVSGRLRNPGPAPRALGTPLAVQLLQPGGDALAGGSTPAGAALPEASLREEAPETLLATQEAAASGFLGAPVAAGAEVGFAAIFAPAPRGAGGFALQSAGAGR